MTRSRMLMIALIAAAVCVASAGVGAGAELHVYPGVGTPIQDAIDGAGEGDTIYVHAGTYVENVDVWKRVTLIGIDTGSGMPIINASGTGSAITLNANGSILEGFVLKGGTRYYPYYDAGIKVISGNNLIRNNNVLNNLKGIYLTSSSSNNALEGNTVHSNKYYGITLSSSNNNFIIDNNIYNNMYGINIFGNVQTPSSNNVVSNNNVSSNSRDGIRLSYSNDNTFSGTNASNNSCGISIYSSTNNTLTKNVMVTNRNYNFCLSGWEDSDFDNRVDTSNLVDGKPIYYIIGAHNITYDRLTNAGTFYCINCNNITIKDITPSKNEYGVFFLNTNNSKLENITASNNRYGIYILSSNDNSLSGNNVSNGGGIVLQLSSNNTLIDNIASNNWGGIGGSYSNNNTITNNKLYSNSNGIELLGSNNKLSKNFIFNSSGIGIFIRPGEKNIIQENIVNCSGAGIILGSANSTLINNIISDNKNGIFILNGYFSPESLSASNSTLKGNIILNNTYNFGVLGHYIHDIDVSNTVNGKPIYYLINKYNLIFNSSIDIGYIAIIKSTNITVRDKKLANNLNGVVLADSSNINISNTDLSNNNYGIYLEQSSNSIIENNIINSNIDDFPLYWYGMGSGVSLISSINNTIRGNTVSNNRRGIVIEYSSTSSFNSIYHNNFINNTYFQSTDSSNGDNSWDSGYPSGGNYWSDYAGIDKYSGPNQDLPGSDDIGDDPRAIPGGSNVDRYPLMQPYSPSTGTDISVDLYFEKIPAMGSSTSTDEFTAGDVKLGYAKTTLTSGDYTVKTYIKMIMPDGTEKYAYSTSSPFCPECPLSFSDTKVSFRPDTWEAETKLWNWDIYKMTGTEPEGEYTWEFWYEDATTGEVLASSAATYKFSRTTELLQEGRHKYFVRISNIDDDGTVYVNGVKMASATFNGDSGWKEISDKLLYDGENDIRFNVTNYPERYPENWTYKFELSTFTDESKIIWEDSCGSVGSKSCNNNQNTGEVYNKTVKLTITPLFTRETVDYTRLDGGDLNLYSIDYNDNPGDSDYMVVVSPLLAQAFVAEETASQEKINDTVNQTEEALTAVLDVHPSAYIYFIDKDMGYKPNAEKLRADVYGLPFVYYRGPGMPITNWFGDYGETKTYREIINEPIESTPEVWIDYQSKVLSEINTIEPAHILILGSAKEFPEYKSKSRVIPNSFISERDFFSDLFYVSETIGEEDEKIHAKIGRVPIEVAYNYFNFDKIFEKNAFVHSMHTIHNLKIGDIGVFKNYINHILGTLTNKNLIDGGEPDEPIIGSISGTSANGKAYKVQYFIAKESYAGNLDTDLKDYSVLAIGWHGNARGIYSKPKQTKDKNPVDLINIHPIVYTGISCLASNVGDYDDSGVGDLDQLFSHKLLTNGGTVTGNTLYGTRESLEISRYFIEMLQQNEDIGCAWYGVMTYYSGKDNKDYLYARNQFRLLGDPALDTSALDDPPNKNISTLPPQFSITTNATYNETPINDRSLLNMSLSDNSSQNITYSLTTDQFATGTGAPKVPIIYIDIPMPVNQTIDNATVVFGDSYTTSINLAEYVLYLLTPDGAEVIPGIEIHGDYPPVNFTYSLVTVPDERLLKIQAIPVKYNIDSQIVELYRSINVTVHTKSFVEENITAKVHIDPSSDYLALHQNENASLIISLYNDYSATENATDVSVTAEIPDNLEIVSANGTINGTIDGNTVTWDVNNLTTSGINSFKSAELLIQAPVSIPDTTIEQINLTATYSNESSGVYEPTEVSIQVSLIPPDYVDLTVSNMVIHRPLKLGTPTNVTAVISNDGDINITYVSVGLLIDGNESSGLIIDTPAMESQSVNLSIGGLTPGKHQIATIVQPIGFETNITNNVATEDVDSYFAMLPPLSTTDPYNLPYGSTLPIKFTVKDNETSEFIPDYTVNVPILNSTNHIITSFNATSGVLIDSDEAQYVVDLNTTNYPELMSGETYAVSVTFGEGDGLLSYATAYFTLGDLTPPRSITDLHPTRGTTWINWTWTNPPDLDFNHTMVYLNGTWQANTSNPFHNATGLSPDASYEIGTHTVDTSGNVNTTWVNQTTNIAQKGDLNGDRLLTPADAAIALQIAASGAHNDTADVSGDGHVTSLDALMILQAAAGRIEL